MRSQPRPDIDAATRSATIRFENVTHASGIHFRWPRQPRPMRNLEALGAGCAFFDYDGDERLDILLVAEPHCVLFRNEGNGRFSDVTTATGLAAQRGPWKGCAVGDYDGDGWTDLFLTGFGEYRLLRNVRGQAWLDRTRRAGVAGRGWGSSAGFMDLDADGDLDLVVGNYVVFGPHVRQYCEFKPGIRSGCPPHHYEPQFLRLFRNDGRGTFTDVTRASGLRDTHGKSLAIAFADYDNDSRIDFYSANDGTPGDLLQNQGNLRFVNRGAAAGVAMGVYNQAQAGMGADWADYDRNGYLDLVVTAFSNEPYSIYRNIGFGFEIASNAVGIAEPTYKPLGFGTKFFDADNDGWPDLVFANGHVYDNTHEIDPTTTYAQAIQLFRNLRGRRFEEIGRDAGPAFTRPIVGRGLATGDYDEDGRIDLLVVAWEEEPLLLRNVTKPAGNWLELELRQPGANRYAYGARVTVRAKENVWFADLSPAASYLSSCAPRFHFGIGDASAIDEVRVRWPDGREDRIYCDQVNRLGWIRRGERKVHWRRGDSKA